MSQDADTKVVQLPARPVQLSLFGPPQPLSKHARNERTYLSKEEIRRLTGRTKKTVQIKVLAARRWNFELDGDGHPLILRSVHDARFGEKKSQAARGPRLEGLSSRR